MDRLMQEPEMMAVCQVVSAIIKNKADEFHPGIVEKEDVMRWFAKKSNDEITVLSNSPRKSPLNKTNKVNVVNKAGGKKLTPIAAQAKGNPSMVGRNNRKTTPFASLPTQTNLKKKKREEQLLLKQKKLHAGKKPRTHVRMTNRGKNLMDPDTSVEDPDDESYDDESEEEPEQPVKKKRRSVIPITCDLSSDSEDDDMNKKPSAINNKKPPAVNINSDISLTTDAFLQQPIGSIDDTHLPIRTTRSRQNTPVQVVAVSKITDNMSPIPN